MGRWFILGMRGFLVLGAQRGRGGKGKGGRVMGEVLRLGWRHGAARSFATNEWWVGTW
jgi:hypothetical protein